MFGKHILLGEIINKKHVEQKKRNITIRKHQLMKKTNYARNSKTGAKETGQEFIEIEYLLDE